MATALDPRKRDRIRFTYADYVRLPDDRRYEILDGDLDVTPSPTTVHQRVLGRLFRLLSDHVAQRELGELFLAPTDVILAKCTVVVPDLLFIPTARARIVKKRGVFGAPELLVEILSHSTYRNDRIRKAELYARYGVRHYWIVDPEEETFEVYKKRGQRYVRIGHHQGDVTIGAEPFPDLALDIGRLWS